MEKLKTLLEEYQAVVRFDDHDIELLGAIGHPLELPGGHILFREQDSGDAVYLVISGTIDLYTCLNETFEQTVMGVRSGGFVGALAMTGETSRDINARAAEDSKLYRFDRDDLQTLMANEQGLGVKLLCLLNDILNKRLRVAMGSLKQNLEWTMQVSGLASLDIAQLIVDRVSIVIDLVNGKQLCGMIMKAEEHPSGFEIFLKSTGGDIHFIPYHAIVSASLPVESLRNATNKLSGT